MAVEANIKTILKAVSSALQLDGSGDVKSAYVSYLQCIQQVAHHLLQDAQTAGVKVGASTKKCVQLGQHCMERVVQLIDSIQTDTLPPSGQSEAEICTDTSLQTTTLFPGESPPNPPPGFQLPELPCPPTTSQSYRPRPSEPSPMEIAQRKNQQLMLAYKKRMASISSKSASATNISLSLQRRMAENMAIARAREEALAKKIQERQRRLEAEAARRFASTAGMSKDEQERRHIYSQVLIYEADAKYLTSWREKLTANPDDSKLIQDLILLIINIKDHPLSQLLTKLQYAIYDKLRPLVLSYIHDLNRITVPYVPSPDREPADKDGSDTGGTGSETETGTGIGSESRTSTDTVIGTVSGTGTKSTESYDSPSSINKATDFSNVFEETKEDLQSALKENTRVSKVLESENKQSEEIRKNLSDVHQFDDLFDKEDNTPTDTKNDYIQVSQAFEAVEMDMMRDLATVTDDEKVENLKRDALDRHMAHISSDVREGMDKLLAMFTVAYAPLDSPAGRDVCWASLEQPFFKPLWPYLLVLYRLGSYEKEIRAAKAMTRLVDVTPADLGVKDKFCPKSPGVRPFQACIDELSRVTHLVSPLAKLESIVRLCKLLCQNMEENSSTQKGMAQATTGADDLLPVLSYVIIHSRQPQLVAECHAMEEFIHEGYLMGEEGYCLTSLQTGLGYVISMAEGNSPVSTG